VTDGKTLGRVRALDGIRAVAIALVVLYHVDAPGFRGGNGGVDVFFVLSGFLITTLLLEEREAKGRLDFRRFYVRRFARLVPALVMMLIVMSVLVLASGVAEPGYGWEVLAAFCYITPVTRLLFNLDGVYDHTWTLATEEYFYLAWPVTLAWMLRRRWTARRCALAMAAVTAALYLLYAALMQAGHEISLLRVAGISAGCALAFVRRSSPAPRRPVLLGCVGALLLAVGTGLGRWDILWPIGFPTLAVGTVCLIWSVVSARDSRVAHVLALRPIAYLGAISYELYLWHYPIFAWFDRTFAMAPSQIWWVVIPVSLGAAAGCHAVAWRVQRVINARFDQARSRRAAARTARPSGLVAGHD